jgi:SNF2 family DNA or RNA helicase
VLNSYPTKSIPEILKDSKEIKTWWLAHFEENKGLLHSVHFHRIILDEANRVKNFLTRVFKATKALSGKHRWVVTGTLITDSIEEVFSYWKFIYKEHTGNIQTFRKNYCEFDNQDHKERLNVSLAPSILRRTCDDKMYGAPIMKLPKSTPTKIRCEPIDFESSIHDAIVLHYEKKMKDTSIEVDRRGLVCV